MWSRKKPIKLEIVRRSETKLRLEEWRNDPQLCRMAAKVLGDPTMMMMLSVLKNEHPARVVLPLGVGLDARAIHQGRCEGYEMFLSALESLSVNTTQAPQPEAVFEEEQV